MLINLTLHCDIGRRTNSHPYEFETKKQIYSKGVTTQAHTATSDRARSFQTRKIPSHQPDVTHPFIKTILSLTSPLVNPKPDTIKSRQAGESFRTRQRQCRPIRRQRCRRPSSIAASRIFLVEEQIPHDGVTITSKSQNSNDRKHVSGVRYPKGNITSQRFCH